MSRNHVLLATAVHDELSIFFPYLKSVSKESLLEISIMVS
jgi:hypothetical protein